MFVNFLKIRFYVDALNLYHRVARPYGVKWLDIEKLLLELVREKIPNATVEKILIFTALVKGDSRSRQEIYIGALEKHSPSIEVVYGLFRDVLKTGVIKKGEEQCVGSLATIRTREEKQTDVNLACRIVEDAYIEKADGVADYDLCCLVSNDSDMAYALDVKRRLEQRILLITPCAVASRKEFREYASTVLKSRVAPEDGILSIGRNLVESCELPEEVGKLHKPPEWYNPSLPRD